jgi:hypothetical protein
MATTLEQLPATVDVAMINGDEYSFPLVFAANLTGYTFSAAVYNAAAGTITAVITPSLTVNVVTGSTPATTVLVSITETQSATLSPTGYYRWYLRWVSPGTVTRTVASGSFQASLP